MQGDDQQHNDHVGTRITLESQYIHFGRSCKTAAKFMIYLKMQKLMNYLKYNLS